ncbi:NUDIX hydrolase [Streptomyces sp. NPDC000351]|uniref:NUDIX hydrolase n=1 Tax=Streptomyces sp. NPDC000351 TaxID=3154250 RepID=UPI00332EBA37
MRRKLRVAAYAICVRDGQVLLARSPGPGKVPEWVLPGGGTEHGEDPHDTVVREVEEETGYRVEPTALLGVGSHRVTRPSRVGPGGFLRRTTDQHAVQLVYEVRVTGGDLRFEVGGSTDLAAWQDLTAVRGLTRVPMVDIGLRLWRERPRSGRVERPRAEEG